MTQTATFKTIHHVRPVRSPASSLDWIVTRVQEILARRRLKAMLQFDQRMLDDIGVNQEEIRDALALPMTANAAESLMRTSTFRRREERGF